MISNQICVPGPSQVPKFPTTNVPQLICWNFFLLAFLSSNIILRAALLQQMQLADQQAAPWIKCPPSCSPDRRPLSDTRRLPHFRSDARCPLLTFRDRGPSIPIPILAPPPPFSHPCLNPVYQNATNAKPYTVRAPPEFPIPLPTRG